MALADWIVSSRAYPDGNAGTITIDAGTPTNVAAAADGLYLDHPTDALSAVEQLAVAMTTGGATTPAVFITEDRRVRITAGATFSLTWGSTAFRDLLGFTGNLAAAASYTATNRSQLLWSSGKIMTPELAPLGAHGQAVADIDVSIGPGGRVVARENGDPSVVQRFSMRHVALDRFWSAPPVITAGEWRHFWANEMLTAQRWYVLRRVGEGSSSTAAADYSLSSAVGPYRPDLSDKDFRRFAFRRSAGFELVEAYYDVTIPALQTAEFS